MSTVRKRTAQLALAAFLCVPLAGAARLTQESNRPATAAPALVADIQFSFKRDQRMVDPFRGFGQWKEGPIYTGATAQDTVETEVRVLDSRGRPLHVRPQWTSSDPETVTVTPGPGDHVSIKVLKAGESTLKITAQGFSRELVVHAQYVDKFILFQIAPPPDKPSRPLTAEMDPSLKGPKEQLSYAAGMRLAKSLRKQSVEVDPELVKQAMEDVLAGGHTRMTDEQVQGALMGVETELNITEALLERKQIADKYKKESEEFLAQNKEKEGVVTLPSGLQYKVIKAGEGRKTTALDVAVCQYKGSLIDGTVFDDSYKRKDGGPVSFPLRAVIKGWQEALKLMPAGSKWELYVPPDLAYGEHGVPRAKIPPNSALIFEVELVSVRQPGDPPVIPTGKQKTPVTAEQLDALKKIIEAEKKEPKPKSETNQ